jgi:hypothetical protein
MKSTQTVNAPGTSAVRHEPLSPYARKTWALLTTLGLIGAGVLLVLHPFAGLVSTIVLGVIMVFLLEPGTGRLPQPRDARLLAEQAAWEAGWAPAHRPHEGTTAGQATWLSPVPAPALSATPEARLL